MQCERTNCNKLATQVISWVHEDGDEESRFECSRHAALDLAFWTKQKWATGVKVHDIDRPETLIAAGGIRTAIKKSGTKLRPATAKEFGIGVDRLTQMLFKLVMRIEPSGLIGLEACQQTLLLIVEGIIGHDAAMGFAWDFQELVDEKLMPAIKAAAYNNAREM
jgi:hypothetical protein